MIFCFVLYIFLILLWKVLFYVFWKAACKLFMYILFYFYFFIYTFIHLLCIDKYIDIDVERGEFMDLMEWILPFQTTILSFQSRTKIYQNSTL